MEESQAVCMPRPLSVMGMFEQAFVQLSKTSIELYSIVRSALLTEWGHRHVLSEDLELLGFLCSFVLIICSQCVRKCCLRCSRTGTSEQSHLHERSKQPSGEKIVFQQGHIRHQVFSFMFFFFFFKTPSKIDNSIHANMCQSFHDRFLNCAVHYNSSDMKMS